MLLAVAGSLALRLFFPAFLIAAGMRLGWIASATAWPVTDAALIALGSLALVEFVAHRSQDARDLLRRVYPPVQGAAVIALLGISPAAALVALAAAALGALRSRALGKLAIVDDEDDLLVQSMLAWLEDAWVLATVAALAVAPAAGGAMGLLVLPGVLALRLAVRRVDPAPDVACVACGGAMHAAALACPRCGAENPDARRVGVLGVPRREPVRDRALHRQQLVEGHRCPACAARLPDDPAPVRCAACGTTVLEAGDRATYVAHVDRRLPRVLVISGLLGLVPVAGALAGIAYHRVKLVAPLRRYLPLRARVVTGLLLGIAYLALASLSWVPLAGALVVPAMAAVAYAAYRRRLLP